MNHRSTCIRRGTINIRGESPSDLAAIEALTEAAFKELSHSSHTEQFIVNALRKADRLSVSLIAEIDGVVVGHVAVSPVSISDGSEEWFGLGPISVTPEHQKKGIGSRLMEQALAELKNIGAAGCVLLGNPEYYARFGFKVMPQLVYAGGPAGYFQVLPFGIKMPSGEVNYHEAFNAQG